MKELRSFDSLAAMLATSRAGSPAKAARALGRAPSSIYRAIERLEKDVGAALFERSIAGWRPTDAGDDVLELGQRIERQITETELSLLRRSRLSPVPLRISASDGFSTYLGPLLAAFAERHGDLAIELIVENKVVDLVRREADVAVRPDMRPGDRLVGQRAGKLAHAFYCSAQLIERHGMPVSARDFNRFRICALTSTLPHFTAANWWNAHEVGAVVAIVANTETALAAAIAGGAGIGILPRFIGDRLGAVVRVPSVQVGDPVDIWLITHPTLRRNAVVRSLIRALAAAIRKDARLFTGSTR
jgi:DNA-binding transcriptional LysR family regulator